MYKQLEKYLETNNLICDHQFSFRKNYIMGADGELFMIVAPLYQEAIIKAGYTYNVNMCTNKKRSRKQKNILCYNPPYSKAVKTNVGAKF